MRIDNRNFLIIGIAAAIVLTIVAICLIILLKGWKDWVVVTLVGSFIGWTAMKVSKVLSNGLKKEQDFEDHLLNKW